MLGAPFVLTAAILAAVLVGTGAAASQAGAVRATRSTAAEPERAARAPAADSVTEPLTAFAHGAHNRTERPASRSCAERADEPSPWWVSRQLSFWPCIVMCRIAYGSSDA